jgi:exodeoxyribonuclease V gamma subunit
LITGGLATLRWVPHRVVCLLGWDASRYPRRHWPGGDDLLAAAPRTLDPDPALNDRQVLADAIQSATDHLIIVVQGRHEITNLPVAPAAPIAELREALDATAHTAAGVGAAAACTQQHSLQPFSPQSYSAPGLISFDQVNFAGAKALQQPKVEPANPFAGVLPAQSDQEPIGLDDLIGFFSHPARALIRSQAGFSVAEAEPPSEEIPIEPNGLEKWQVGEKYLRLLLSGQPAERINASLWRSGEVPPGKLGAGLLTSISQDAQALIAALPTRAEPQAHDVELTIGTMSLLGRITTQDDYLLTTTFSRRNPRNLLAAWVRLLALAASEPGPWKSATLSRPGFFDGRAPVVELLAAPDPAAALRTLEDLVVIYRYGSSHPIPALPRINAEWAQLRNIGQDPLSKLDDLKGQWDKDSDAHWTKFFSFPEVLTQSIPADFPLPVGSEITFAGALAELIWVPLLAAEVSR